MAVWPWYGGLALGEFYGAAEFLSVQDYRNLQRWVADIGQRRAVRGGGSSTG